MKRKDLLGIRDLIVDELSEILTLSSEMKKILKQDIKKTPHLQGKSIMTLFYENSTRTRMSFEVAAKFMSAVACNMSVSTSSVSKGETLIDTVKTLDDMKTDIIIIRHSMAGAPALAAAHTSAGIINAGDGLNEHPTQALLDMFTMKEKFGTLKLKVAIIGDIKHSRVAKSNLYGLTKMGAEVVMCSPKTMMPVGIETLGGKICNDKYEAVKGADVVMGLRIQKERQQGGLFPSVAEYHKYYGIDLELLKGAKENAVIMHPGPVNRGVELASMAYDSEFSLIDEQVLNGVAVRMAILYLLK